MNLENIYPNNFNSFGESLESFLTGLLIRSNFSSNIRSHLGWNGLSLTCKNGEGWTCKIKGCKGIYGIYYYDFNKDAERFTSKYKLCYFPDKEEDVIENYSVDAAYYSQAPEYMKCIREFLCYPEFTELFNIAEISFSFIKNTNAILISLKARNKLLSISPEGIFVENNYGKQYLVEPGGVDQNLAAFDLAKPFFDVLATTVTYNLSESPAYIFQAEQEESEQKYQDDKISKIELSIGYGEIDFENSFNLLHQFDSGKSAIIKQWKTGDPAQTPFHEASWWDVHKHQKFTRINKNSLGIDDRPRFILLSGFLGSGKTSFLKRFIEYHVANNRFVAVIQNEIGETGLDGKLLEDEYAVLEMDEGCVCCSLIGQLKKGIKQILNDQQPDVIILETTGVANPFNLLADLEEISDLIKFESVTTVIDGENILDTADKYEIVMDQVKAADILLLNKIDQINKEQTKNIVDFLRCHNTKAVITECKHGDINPALLYDEHLREYYCDNEKNNGEHNTEGISEFPNLTHTHSDDGLNSLKVPLHKPLNRKNFLTAIDSMPGSVFRLKGVIDFDDDSGSFLIQYVNGHYDLEKIDGERIKERFILLIGKDPSINSLIQCMSN